jgi:hypothetical protein
LMAWWVWKQSQHGHLQQHAPKHSLLDTIQFEARSWTIIGAIDLRAMIPVVA